MQFAILILAAGASSRMRGADKLLEPVSGQPLIAHMAEQAIKTGARVLVAVPALDHPRARIIQHLDACLIDVPNASGGMAISLTEGIRRLPPEITRVAITPADLPDLVTADFEAFTTAAHTAGPATILQAMDLNNKPGHPVVFPRLYFPELLALSGDQGAKAVLDRHRPLVVPVSIPNTHPTTDLDTPEDWATWRANKARENSH